LPQSLPQLLTDDASNVVPHQRRQQCADIFGLLPTALGFFSDQMKTASRDQIAFETIRGYRPFDVLTLGRA
jgi:hypothetical protein